MKDSVQLIFALSLLVTVIMGALSYLSYRRYREVEFSHLTEFWASLGVNTLVMGIFSSMMPSVVALSMVGWLWPLRTFRLYLGDITAQPPVPQWKFILLAAGAFITVALAGYGFDFTYYTLPFALTVGIVGFYRLWDNYRISTHRERSILHVISWALMAFFYLTCLAFPFWRIRPDTEYFGIVANFMLNVGFAGVAFSTYFESIKRRHDHDMESILKERNERLLGQSKYAELGMMSAGIAHEINNPLAVIQARTTQLLRIYKDPERQKDLADGLQQILYTSERINRTIQGVREFVHHDERAPMTEIELKNLVDDVLAFCGQRMKNHGINLRFYGLDELSLHGNKIQLEQVILNLLNNSFDAIEYLPDKWIEISAQRSGDRIHIYVKDSGPGIPPDVAEKMMDPFFSTKDLGKGTGLGLALAQGILEKHGGRLLYLSDANHTTFLVELPCEPNISWGMSLQ